MPCSNLKLCNGASNFHSAVISRQLDDSFDNRRFVRRIQEAEIGEALKMMKGGKAMGPDGIPIEVWRYLGARAIVWLREILRSGISPRI
jgi:hypothetical protein